MTERLTSLQAVKDWLGITEDDADEQLLRHIDGASQLVLNYLARNSFVSQSYTDQLRGNGKDNIILRNWPVLGVTSLFVAGTAIEASTFNNVGVPTNGYQLGPNLEGPNSLFLNGSAFYAGAPVKVTYTAGYQTSQAFTTAVGQKITPTAKGQWIANVEVTSGSTVLTEVASAPAAGQYSVDEAGEYTFADADAPMDVLITYDYAPMDIANATMEIVGEAWRRREHIGQVSKSLGGQQTASYSQKDMNDTVKLVLNNYRRVVPL